MAEARCGQRDTQNRSMTSIDRYRVLCESEPSIPLFSRAWWLDTLAGSGHWEVVLVESGGQIVASMPYMIRRRLGRVFLGHPPLTQTLGPWIRDTSGKQASRLARQKDLMQQLIAGLPKYHHYNGNWHHSQANWLPFYWAGFSQTTRYTYRLTDISAEETLWSGFRDNIRRDIRKAEGRFGLRVRSDLGLDTFLRLHVQTFSRQEKQLPYSETLVKELDAACEQRKARRIFIAEGKHELLREPLGRPDHSPRCGQPHSDPTNRALYRRTQSGVAT
jgi:hypothetical protein